MAVDIPSMPSPASEVVDVNRRFTTEWALFFTKLFPTYKAASSALQEIPVDDSILHDDQASVLTKGFRSGGFSAGTISSGTFTPNWQNGNLQNYTNNGAHTIGAPATDCTIVIRMTNGSTPGSPNLSAFSRRTSEHDLTPGKGFWVNIVVINGFGLISILADN